MKKTGFSTTAAAPGAAPRRLDGLYAGLLDAYGPQGWWPLLGQAGKANPTITGALTGYHPGEYDFPRTPAEQFEICCGAILTQNTAWVNVEKALLRLRDAGRLTPDAILRCAPAVLEDAVRPSGYYRAKARKLAEFARFFLGLRGRIPSRDELLGVWGIGPETADSMRLYAFRQTEMVADAYTRRGLHHHGFLPADAGYETIRDFCRRGLPATLEVYQEFHALMVEHAKRRRAGRKGSPPAAFQE